MKYIYGVIIFQIGFMLIVAGFQDAYPAVDWKALLGAVLFGVGLSVMFRAYKSDPY